MARLKAVALSATLAGLALWPAAAGANTQILTASPPSVNGVPLTDPDFVSDIMDLGSQSRPTLPPRGVTVTGNPVPFQDFSPGGRSGFTRPSGGMKVDPIIAGIASHDCEGAFGCFQSGGGAGANGGAGGGGPIGVPIGFGGDSVPEPAAWALLLTGIAGLGSVVRARRRRPALSA